MVSYWYALTNWPEKIARKMHLWQWRLESCELYRLMIAERWASKLKCKRLTVSPVRQDRWTSRPRFCLFLDWKARWKTMRALIVIAAAVTRQILKIWERRKTVLFYHCHQVRIQSSEYCISVWYMCSISIQIREKRDFLESMSGDVCNAIAW